MDFTLPNVEMSSISWNAASSDMPGFIRITLIIQGMGEKNVTLECGAQYTLSGATPALSYLEAYQKAYQYLHETLNLRPDEEDQFDQWNQRIVQQVNAYWTQMGLPAPDLNQNDWSAAAPFFTQVANKTGSTPGSFTLPLGFQGEGGGGF